MADFGLGDFTDFTPDTGYDFGGTPETWSKPAGLAG